MLYKVYVNVCDFRAGSYVNLETRAAQFHIYVHCTHHWDDPCQIVLHLIYWFITIRFFKKCPFLAPSAQV